VIRGAVYFVLVFGAGFFLGVLRVLVVEPRLGQRSAELLEAPLMLAVIYFAARFITRRFRAARAVEYFYSGLLALTLLVSAEFSVVLGLQGLSVRESIAERDPVAGTVYGGMLVIFAAMPWLVSRRR
jgi:hypothetical protein